MTNSDYGNLSPTSSGLSRTESMDELAVLPENKWEIGPKSSRLVNLPRELRDKIYGYFLRSNRFNVLRCDEKTTPKLDLSILRVSHMFHKEASEILFDANPWVCIAIEPVLLDCVSYEEEGNRRGFPGDTPVPMASYTRAAATAHATITIQTLPQLGPATDRLPLLVSLYAMPRLCRILTTCQMKRKVDIFVQSNVLNNGKLKVAWHERLLDCLKEARGCGRVTIFDAQGNLSHGQLSTLMISPLSLEAIHDRVSTYHDRGLENKSRGMLSDARCDYMEGLDYVSWFRARRCHRVLDVSGNENMVQSIRQMVTTIGFACAFLCIKLGDIEWANYLIEWALELQGNERLHRTGAEAWYLYGLRDLTIGSENGAIYCFLQTLWRQPGHQGADEAVDELEARLQSCTGLTERIVLHNIQHVLQPLRHRIDGSAVMSRVGYSTLMEEWYTGMKEPNSVGYGHSSRNSSRLEYSRWGEPW